MSFFDAVDIGVVAMVLGALLAAALLVALVASAQPSDPLEPDPLLEVRDRTPHVVTYVDAECPVCGDPAISTTEEIVCNNELCPEYGRVRENGNEYPEVDEYLREMGE